MYIQKKDKYLAFTLRVLLLTMTKMFLLNRINIDLCRIRKEALYPVGIDCCLSRDAYNIKCK